MPSKKYCNKHPVKDRNSSFRFGIIYRDSYIIKLANNYIIKLRLRKNDPNHKDREKKSHFYFSFEQLKTQIKFLC
jgi:hypothetical protein